MLLDELLQGRRRPGRIEIVDKTRKIGHVIAFHDFSGVVLNR